MLCGHKWLWPLSCSTLVQSVKEACRCSFWSTRVVVTPSSRFSFTPFAFPRTFLPNPSSVHTTSRFLHIPCTAYLSLFWNFSSPPFPQLSWGHSSAPRESALVPLTGPFVRHLDLDCQFLESRGHAWCLSAAPTSGPLVGFCWLNVHPSKPSSFLGCTSFFWSYSSPQWFFHLASNMYW